MMLDGGHLAQDGFIGIDERAANQIVVEILALIQRDSADRW